MRPHVQGETAKGAAGNPVALLEPTKTILLAEDDPDLRSLLAGVLLEASQVLRFTIANHMPALVFNTDMTWLNSPLALLLAALCLCIALCWLPRTGLANAR